MFVVLQSIDHTHIDKQSMDGRGDHSHIVEERLSTKGSFSFAVDEQLETIFFSDTKGNKIEYLVFDGDSRHVFEPNIKRPSSLAVVDESLYWTSQNSKSIYFTDKQNVGQIKKIKIDTPEKLQKMPSFIQLVAVTPIKVTPHVCKVKNGGCSHICVSNGPSSRTCLCSMGMVFDSPENLNCVFGSKCEFK